MLRSMTGFGRQQQLFDEYDITVEIKSLNHRFLEFAMRTPRQYGFLDDRLKSLVQSNITRGKVEISVMITRQNASDVSVTLNQSRAQQYVDAMREANAVLGLPDDLSLSKLAGFTDLFMIQQTAEDQEQIWSYVHTVANGALQNLIGMREFEGGRLREDLYHKYEQLGVLLAQVEQLAPQAAKAYEQRLLARLQDVLRYHSMDQQRIATEVAVYAEHVSIDEEVVRFQSHLKQFQGLLDNQEAVGRKLDFLVQELNREINCIGSKAQDVNITGIVVDMKAELEKIREQIQNIE